MSQKADTLIATPVVTLNVTYILKDAERRTHTCENLKHYSTADIQVRIVLVGAYLQSTYSSDFRRHTNTKKINFLKNHTQLPFTFIFLSYETPFSLKVKVKVTPITCHEGTKWE
jgi:hypothetical protein